MKEALKQALDEAWWHWDHMINWARKQKPDEMPSSVVMFETIGENWFGLFCPLCKMFDVHNRDDQGICTTTNGMETCPLSPDICGQECCDEWERVEDAETWEQWGLRAQDMQDRIKREREELG